MSERNRLIHSLLERGCWHDKPKSPPHKWGYDVVARCAECDVLVIWDTLNDDFQRPHYFSPNIPHSLVVEIVTKAVERFGELDVTEKVLMRKDSRIPLFNIPATVIVGAVADMCEMEAK